MGHVAPLVQQVASLKPQDSEALRMTLLVHVAATVWMNSIAVVAKNPWSSALVLVQGTSGPQRLWHPV